MMACHKLALLLALAGGSGAAGAAGAVGAVGIAGGTRAAMIINLSCVGGVGTMAMGMGTLSLGVVAGQKLSPEQIYGYARAAGFPPSTATQMTAIALRESRGYTGAYYSGATGTEESSHGLWQINIQDPGVRRALQNAGVDANNLSDPLENARAAYALWGGNDANLDVAWYINRPKYREGYEAMLLLAEQAAGEYEAGGAGQATGVGGQGQESLSPGPGDGSAGGAGGVLDSVFGGRVGDGPGQDGMDSLGPVALAGVATLAAVMLFGGAGDRGG